MDRTEFDPLNLLNPSSPQHSAGSQRLCRSVLLPRDLEGQLHLSVAYQTFRVLDQLHSAHGNANEHDQPVLLKSTFVRCIKNL